MNDSSLHLEAAADLREQPAAPGWPRALAALVITLLWILACFHETARSMVGIWAHSATFTHGFIVPPITLWLIWQKRQQIAVQTPRSNIWFCLPMALAGFAWLLGALAEVNALTQFALVSMLVLAVPAVLGWSVTRLIRFPLGFLFFAVPFGDFVVPQMMEWTANFTVMGLRLSGIPVYREGLQFVVPSGTWSVVEACSGARYLIASLTVGTLFAYLNYQSTAKRLLFMLAALVVPVLANWLRAYFIVLLGYLSDNRLAAGVDHLVYGWIFFGIVILAMFWVGARWREDEPPLTEVNVPISQTVPTPSRSLLTAALLVGLTLVWPLSRQQLMASQTVTDPLTVLPTLQALPDWQSTYDARLASWRPRFEQANSSLQGSLRREQHVVGYFLAYYRNQNGQRELVNSANMLVNSEDPSWVKLEVGKRPTQLGEQTVDVRTTVLRGLDNTRLLVWQWYWVNGRLTASDAYAKAYTALSRLTGQGDDSAVIVLYTPIERTGNAEATLAEFALQAEPVIEASLKQARGSR